jgi:alkylhydroperoxidase/carboxymuconolactone decarboxylase family protein YurZ
MSAKEELSSRAFYSKRFPEVWEAFNNLRRTTGAALSFDRKTTELLTLAMHCAVQAEIGVKLHAQRARDAGATEEEIYGVVLLNLGVTMGVTQVQRMIMWVDDALA